MGYLVVAENTPGGFASQCNGYLYLPEVNQQTQFAKAPLCLIATTPQNFSHSQRTGSGSWLPFVEPAITFWKLRWWISLVVCTKELNVSLSWLWFT